MQNGKLSAQPVAQGSITFTDPGATPAISANGTKNGIVWAVQTKTWNGRDRRATLRAYDAANVARELWNSDENAERDQAGVSLRFVVPTVARGRVYVGVKGAVEAYGLLGSH